MKIRKYFFTTFACAALSAAAAQASQLDTQLDKIDKQFVQDASAKLPDLNPVTVMEAAVALRSFGPDYLPAFRRDI